MTDQHETVAAQTDRPWFKKKRFIIPIGVFVLLGIIGSFIEEEPEPEAKPKAAPASTEPTQAPTPEQTTPEPSPSVQATPGMACDEKAGDGSNRVDFTKVKLTVVDEVVFEASLTKAIPESGTASVGVAVSSADGEQSKQLAAKWVDGYTSGAYIFDGGSATQDNLAPETVKVDGRKVRLTFPPTAVSNLRGGWKWRAFATDDGDDVDACPGDVLSFDNLTFRY